LAAEKLRTKHDWPASIISSAALTHKKPYFEGVVAS